MGYSLELFVNCEVDEEFICLICQGVLEKPVMLKNCEHLFCKECIENWIKRSRTCPTDRGQISNSAMHPAPRFLRKMLDNLKLKCTTEKCDVIVKIQDLETHLTNCPWSLKQCQYSCGTQLTQEQISSHNCSKYLSDQLQSKNQETEMLKSTIQNHLVEIERLKITEQNKKKEIQRLKSIIQTKEKELQSLTSMLPQLPTKSSLPKVFIDIAVDDKPFGRITFELRTDIVTKTCELFRVLCTGEKASSYRGSEVGISRISGREDFLVLTNCAIEESEFSIPPENYTLKHSRPGVISFIRGKSNVGPSFIVTTKKSDLFLERTHVVFGSVVDGLNVIKRLQNLPETLYKIFIINCGELSS